MIAETKVQMLKALFWEMNFITSRTVTKEVTKVSYSKMRLFSIRYFIDTSLIDHAFSFCIMSSSNAPHTSESTKRIMLSSSFDRDRRFALPYQTV